MRQLGLMPLFVCLFLMPCLAAEPGPVQLVPAASEARWGQPVSVQGPAAILLSVKATPAEREAARLLAMYVQRRFGQEWTVGTAGEAPTGLALRVLLGKRGGFPELDRMCREQNLAVVEHPEGYALKVWAEGGATTALVAGESGRAVFYGADTLFQLLRREADKLIVQEATIRDWPTIPLRGRPHPHFEYFLRSENFDCIMSSRINFIDLRDGIYAFEPGAKLKRDELGGIIQMAKDRDLRVYAAVNCGVTAAEQDAVLATFREFIDMGADGLWASFDDKGSGESPERMLKRVIALGREHSITGDAIAITPPKGDYQTVRTKFNTAIVAVPGMEQAVWYWTSVPCAEDLADARSIGMTVKPSWWHNWPRIPHASFRAGSDHAYSGALDLGDGWNHPQERDLRAMGDFVHAVMPWDGWQAQQHYLVPMIGWWSWRPEQYTFEAIRGRAYDMVFGPGQVKTAALFDDELKQIRSRFQFWNTHTDSAPHCPPRLKTPSDRGRTISALEALQAKLPSFCRSAVSASLIEPDTLERQYLNALTREVETAIAATRAPYPEYWWPAHQDAVLNAIYDGDDAGASRLMAGVRDRLLGELGEVERLLPHVSQVGKYVAWWKERANTSPADWRKLLEARQNRLREFIPEYSKTVAPVAQLLSDLGDPPIQAGTRVWARHNRLLATVVPQARETFWGDWIGGLHTFQDQQVAVFALAKHDPVNAGTHVELPVVVPVSGRRDRLALILYLADANKESFGLGRARWRWSGTRAIKLLWGEKELWSADLGIPRLTGEWFIVPLPELPADLDSLPLRLRVEDYYSAKNNLEIVYVGPIRLVELDRD